MLSGKHTRLAIAMILLVVGFFWIRRTSIEPSRVNLYITAVIGAVTAIYALFTYEILLQNQSMAQAAVDSTRLTEQSLRFSYSENLIYQTLNTKDPTFKLRTDTVPIDNADYRRALSEESGEQQKEFIFAVVKNVGRGAATSLSIEAQYRITDSSNVNREYSVTRKALVQILEPDKAVALCIFFSKVPTRDDQALLTSATITTSNFYRDALKQPAQQTKVDPATHKTESEPACVIQLG